MSDDLVKQITVYLSNGGLFNPEMMDHDKVRNLLMDCRDRIEKLEAQLAQSQFIRWAARFEEQSDRIEKLEADLEVATMKRVRDSDRIQKMEAALVHIYTWYPTSLFNPHQTIKDIKEFARKSLEEINTSQERVKKEGES